MESQKSSDKLTLGKLPPKYLDRKMKFPVGKGPTTGKMTKQVSLTTIWKRPEQNSDSKRWNYFLNLQDSVSCESTSAQSSRLKF